MSRYRYTKKQKINKKDYYTTTVYKKIIEFFVHQSMVWLELS